MTAAEQQTEELEVLRSIFDGESAFNVTGNNSIQYRFGDEGDRRSFLLEIRWPDSYPVDAVPNFILDLFYNKHLNGETKNAILQCLTEEADSLAGFPMTYSLIEMLKDRFEQLTQTVVLQSANIDSTESGQSEDAQRTKENQTQGKGEKLTKAQKRKKWDRGEANDEKARGWNWVDVVKHLSQTGHS